MKKIEKISKLFLFVEKYRSKYIFGLILAFAIIILLVLSNSTPNDVKFRYDF